MGLNGPDVALFAVGFLLFAGAAGALYFQSDDGTLPGGGSSPTNVYSVLFPLSKVEVGKESVADFASASKTFTVNATQVARMLVSIQCTDTLPGSTFTLQVRVEPPNGLTADPKAGTCGSELEVEVRVAQPPTQAAVTGRDRDAALASLQRDASATLAIGEWTVTVSGARGGAPVGLPAGNPGGAIVLTAEVWEAELTPVVR